MKKRIFRLGFCFALALAFLLSGCGAPAALSPSPTGQATSVPATEATPAFTPSESASPSPPAGSPSDWAAIYTDFLGENYDGLDALCYGGIAGVGFIDLDLDGTPELALFDAGAGAAMGAYFFDIADGRAVCVSANNPDVGTAYGAGYFTDVYVNANYFDDFRLMEDIQSGERYFLVESGNGDETFSYKEDIRFGRDGGGVLTLTSLLYQYVSYGPGGGEDLTITGSQYKQGDQSVSGEAYASAYAALFASCKQVDYTPAGAFLWEDKAYDGTGPSFLGLVQMALSRYAPIPGSGN